VARLRLAVAHGAGDAPRKRPRRPFSDVEEVIAALSAAEHDVEPVAIDGTRESLARLARLDVDLLFNMVEGFGEDDTKEPHVAAYLELLGIHFTGSGSRGLAVGIDKPLTKKVLQFHAIPTPRFITVFRGRVNWADELRFPVIVKPAREDGSIGIGFGALVEGIKELMERIDALHADFGHPVLVEEYIEGREIYVGVLGNSPPEALPPIELDLSHLPKGTPRIAASEVKWEQGTRAYRGSKSRVAQLPEPVAKALQDAAVTAFLALALRDYARFDFRLAADGTPYLIEANPNPHLQSSSEFCRAARAAGRTHPRLIREIVEHALRRYGVKA
jgi:D-alanine-D-alanine ligase